MLNAKAACLLVGVAAFSSVQAHAVTLELTNFISSPIYFNGFEGIGGSGTYPINTDYSEGGITVRGALDPGPYYAHVGTTPTSVFGGMGNYFFQSYGNGYTDIKLTGGGEINAIQFLVAGGWTYPTWLEYRVLNLGVVVAEGTIQNNGYVYGGYQYLGFSGGGFDEVLVQDTWAYSSFDPTQFSAPVIDNIAANPTPLPAALPLFATGLSALGLLGWRRKRKNAALAA
jgi:hypothetical protein